MSPFDKAAYDRAWHREHHERVLELKYEWKRRNIEHVRTYNREYRRRQRAAFVARGLTTKGTPRKRRWIE